MARIIEALKQAESHRARPPETVAAPSPELEPSSRTEAGEEAGEMSFIEVGGKGQPMSASADVLAATPSPRTAPSPPTALPRSGGEGSKNPSPVLQVERKEGPPIIAPLFVAFQPWTNPCPSSRLASELIAFHQPDHPTSQRYQELLDSLLQDQQNQAAPVFLLTAATSGVGATTVLLNLAIRACAGGQRRVAVVDLNLRRPALAARLGLPSVPGLCEVLVGAAAPEQALQATAVSGLFALTASPGPGASPALTAEALRWLVCWLRERFDLSFVDGPPWEEGAELATLVVLADGVYPVLSEAEAQSPAAAQLLRAISRRGGRPRGVLHTLRAA